MHSSVDIAGSTHTHTHKHTHTRVVSPFVFGFHKKTYPPTWLYIFSNKRAVEANSRVTNFGILTRNMGAQGSFETSAAPLREP